MRVLLTYLGLLLFAVAPLLAAFLSWAIAERFGCQVNFAGPQPCPVFGVDVGSVLNTLAVSSLLARLTIPLGFLGLFGYTGYLLLTAAENLFLRFRARK